MCSPYLRDERLQSALDCVLPHGRHGLLNGQHVAGQPHHLRQRVHNRQRLTNVQCTIGANANSISGSPRSRRCTGCGGAAARISRARSAVTCGAKNAKTTCVQTRSQRSVFCGGSLSPGSRLRRLRISSSARFQSPTSGSKVSSHPFPRQCSATPGFAQHPSNSGKNTDRRGRQ